VDLVDNDFLATASAKENIEINHIKNARVHTGDLLEPVSSNNYDLIISNPPFHAGKSVDYQTTTSLIQQAFHALTSPGKLIMVANRFIPYDRLIKEVFNNVSTLNESRAFRVLSGIK
jgi:16S rRNA (guanine1207-N2)-methyltransferase